MNYSLLDEKWIPVLYRDGRWERVGIRKALEDAGKIRQIAASNPMDRVAILRFLLALLYWCKGNPPDNADATSSDSFPTEWFSKLDENRECFNLLGEGKRFYQNGAYQGIEAEHTTNYLIHEVPSGTNKWHFRHSMDKRNGLCPACCAMGLIRLPLFATSGAGE
jgi:CRISPR system Cascade subunit CasA